MAPPGVVVLDYGFGNVHSAVRALQRVGAEVTLTRQTEKVLEADGLVVPGVGAFAAVMRALSDIDALRWIGRRIAGGRPVLGICVGHQILFERGVEHGIERGVAAGGMGEWPGDVTGLPHDVVVPHMGWNTVRAPQGSVLFEGLADERFYFVHSYAVQSWQFDATIPQVAQPKVTWAHHGTDFIAAVENGPLSATQFHPEKSGEAGMQLLRNWITSL